MDQPGVWRALNTWFKDAKLWRATTGWSQPKHSQKVSTSTENPRGWKGSFSSRQELCSHHWTVLSLWGTLLLCPHSLDDCITEDLRPASSSEKSYLPWDGQRWEALWVGGLGLSSAPQGPSLLGSTVSWLCCSAQSGQGCTGHKWGEHRALSVPEHRGRAGGLWAFISSSWQSCLCPALLLGSVSVKYSL